MPNSPFDILLDKTSILEIAANGTVVGNLSTSDPDTGDTFNYELLDNAGGRFTLVNGNQIAVADNSKFNYQNAIFHTIKVRTTDSTLLSYEKDINIGLINAKRNLVGYWKLDETTGTFDNASFVNGNNDGSTQGSLNLGREGLVDQAVGFGGGQVNLGKNLLNYSTGATSFSVAAWIKPTNFNDNQSIVAVDANGGTNGWSLGLSGNQLYLYFPSFANQFFSGIVLQATIPPDILANQWFHVALTYQGSTRTLYVNGIQIATSSSTTYRIQNPFAGTIDLPLIIPAADSNRDYLIGAENSNGSARFVGDIDEVRIYNKGLSQAEILERVIN